MFSTKRNTDPFPPAKPNGDTNRDLIDIEIALARDMGFEKNIIVVKPHMTKVTCFLVPQRTALCVDGSA